MTITTVLFDMDGVIFEGENFWLDVHRAYGTEEEGVRLANLYLKADYMTLIQEVGRGLWQGRSAAPYLDLVQSRRYEPGIEGVIDACHRRGLRTGIISSGSFELASRAQRELGIDWVRANSLQIEDGQLTGEVTVMVPDDAKLAVGLEMLDQMGALLVESAVIGDGAADAALVQAAGLGVAYNTRSDELRLSAKHCLERGQLPRFCDLLDFYLDEPK